MLQFLAAKAYLQRELLGKAKTMFLAVTVAGVSNAIKRQAWNEIAQIEASRDDHDAAQAAWRSAALA